MLWGHRDVVPGIHTSAPSLKHKYNYSSNTRQESLFSFKKNAKLGRAQKAGKEAALSTIPCFMGVLIRIRMLVKNAIMVLSDVENSSSN